MRVKWQSDRCTENLKLELVCIQVENVYPHNTFLLVLTDVTSFRG